MERGSRRRPRGRRYQDMETGFTEDRLKDAIDLYLLTLGFHARGKRNRPTFLILVLQSQVCLSPSSPASVLSLNAAYANE